METLGTHWSPKHPRRCFCNFKYNALETHLFCNEAVHLCSIDLKMRLALSELVSSRVKANKWKYYVEAAKTIHVCVLQYVLSNRFFENQPNENCSYLREKESKGRFLKPEKLQNLSHEGRRKEKKKERGEGKEEQRKKQWLHS